MTREELTARLAECEGHTPGEWDDIGPGPLPGGHRIFAGTNHIGWIANSDMGEGETAANARLIALAPALASALREAWAEIDRLKAHLPNPLDAALNEGDGTYKP